MWRKGQDWRVVRSLNKLNEQVRAAHPRATPPATPSDSWGSIADSEHSSTSDHYPHYYNALGPVAVVCARDFPHAPRLGLDAHEIADSLQRSRDSRLRYIISNRRIAGASSGWEWDHYSGKDPHDTHIHVSSVRTARADNEADFDIGGDMAITQDEIDRIAAKAASTIINSGTILNMSRRLHAITTGRDPIVFDDEGNVTEGNRLHQLLAGITAGVSNVDEEVLLKLGDADISAEEIADLLRPVLGDRSAAVGAALQSGGN